MKYLLILSILLTSCYSTSGMTDVDREADQLIVDFAKTIKSKGLKLVGIGGGINHETGKHKLFNLTFMTPQIETLEDARKLIVETLAGFLSFVNSNESVRESLNNFPLTPDNVRIGILCENDDPDQIASVSNCGDMLYYYMVTETPPVTHVIYKEAFEEGKRILDTDPCLNKSSD